jgi:hypothetical protein
MPYCNGQFLKRIYSNDFDSTYISSHSGKIIIGPFISSNTLLYNIGDDKYADHLTYQPNGRLSGGFSIGYKFFTFYFGWKLPSDIDNPEKYGTTDHFKIGWSDFSRKLIFDIYAEFYKGFFLTNSQLIEGYQKQGPYYVRPDIVTGQLGTSLFYIFNNKRFSYKAAFGQSEYQKKSSGSVLMGIVFNYNVSQGDSAIIPQNLIYPEFWAGSDFYRSANICLSINGGYAYNFIFKKHYFLAGQLVPGIGISGTHLYGTGTNPKGYGLLLHNTFRISLGYNSEWCKGSISFVDNVSHDGFPTVNTWLEYDAQSFEIGFVVRLKAPKIKLF